jgi:hypothetical protein
MKGNDPKQTNWVVKLSFSLQRHYLKRIRAIDGSNPLYLLENGNSVNYMFRYMSRF